MLKKTFRDLVKMRNTYGLLVEEKPEILQTKLHYAFKKLYENSLESIFAKHDDALETLRVEHALTDKETGALRLNAANKRGYDYDPAGQKAIIAAESKFSKEWSVLEFEIDPVICKEVPVLTEEQTEQFEGIIIPENNLVIDKEEYE